MIPGDVEIPRGSIIFSPKVLFTRDADAWDVELVIRCAVKGTNLTDRELCGWFNRVADPVQRVQGDCGSDESGDSDESIQDDVDYAGPDSGGEIL